MPNQLKIIERMVGDTSPPITGTLVRDGSVVNLSGKTVAFRMLSQAGEVIVDSEAATVVSASGGTVSFTCTDTHVENAGTYYGWWIVTGSGSPEHFPHDGRKLRIQLIGEEE